MNTQFGSRRAFIHQAATGLATLSTYPWGGGGARPAKKATLPTQLASILAKEAIRKRAIGSTQLSWVREKSVSNFQSGICR